MSWFLYSLENLKGGGTWVFAIWSVFHSPSILSISYRMILSADCSSSYSCSPASRYGDLMLPNWPTSTTILPIVSPLASVMHSYWLLSSFSSNPAYLRLSNKCILMWEWWRSLRDCPASINRSMRSSIFLSSLTKFEGSLGNAFSSSSSPASDLKLCLRWSARHAHSEPPHKKG